MAEAKKIRIPVAVLERARQVSSAPRPPEGSRPSDRPKASAKPKQPREKIVEALRKLHPMD